MEPRSGASAAGERTHQRLECRAQRAARRLRAARPARAPRARPTRAARPAVRVQALLVAQLPDRTSVINLSNHLHLVSQDQRLKFTGKNWSLLFS